MSRVSALASSNDLQLLEAIIERGKKTFIEVGLALMRIHQGGLYREKYATWEEYCQGRWGWTRQRAYQLMEAADVAMSNTFDTPLNARQASELARAPKEQRESVMTEAAELGGGRPTAALIRDVVDRRTDGKAKSPSKQDMRTPRWFFDFLSKKFGPFELDAYASKHNALCPRFYTIEEDGNVQPWVDLTFGNPGFRKGERTGMALCMAKAVEEQEKGNRSCIVGPVGCSQQWFHELAIQGTIFAPDARINFDEPEGVPTEDADRDTHVFVFGKGWRNQEWKRGIFRMRRLEIKDLIPGGV